MSLGDDKRNRRDLDMFVLALIEAEISTPYELQQSASLSPGATIPALRRLVAAGFVLAGKPGPRGRTEHRVSAAGRQHLKREWRSLVDGGPSGDLDADLRVALLAFVVGRQRSAAVRFLQLSVERRLESAASEKEPSKSDSLPKLAAWYRQLRAESAKLLAKAEGTAALNMADAIQKGSARTRTRKRVRPKA